MGDKFSNSFPVPSKPAKSQQNFLATLLAKVLHERAPQKPASPPSRGLMILHTRSGARKYLNVAERRRFASAADTMPPKVRAFCLLLMWSGCRISEALAVTPAAIDQDAGTVALVTLKRRSKIVIREVPLPPAFVRDLVEIFDLPFLENDEHLAQMRLWPWSRSTGWRYVKEVMRRAAIVGAAAMPKGLRHALGVAAFEAVPPHLVQRWLGHASLRTTAIYGGVSGPEEHLLAKRIWDGW